MQRLFSIVKYFSTERLSLLEFLSLIKNWLITNHIVRIYMVGVNHGTNKSPSPSDQVQIRKGSLIELFTYENQFSSTAWEFRCHKFDGVEDFFVVGDPGYIQHISWIYYRGDPNRIIQLGQRDAEIKYSLTLPAFRGQGFYPEVIKTIVSYLRERGYRRVFISANRNNHASIRAIEKSGSQFLTQIRLRKIFGIQVSRRYVPSEL
jgi:RimJ/RimL family protein N-acetyltransferase